MQDGKGGKAKKGAESRQTFSNTCFFHGLDGFVCTNKDEDLVECYGKTGSAELRNCQKSTFQEGKPSFFHEDCFRRYYLKVKGKTCVDGFEYTHCPACVAPTFARRAARG